MQITIELPEDIAVGLESKWNDLPRAALESLALEAYRSRALTAAQLRRLLVFETRMQVDAFLKEHEVYDFTAVDFEQDRETLCQASPGSTPTAAFGKPAPSSKADDDPPELGKSRHRPSQPGTLEDVDTTSCL
jgi:hypothetical protein